MPHGHIVQGFPYYGMVEPPPLSRKFAHPPPPRKIFPSGLPHQIFIPSQATQLLPPLNNNFQVTHNKNSIFLAVDIAPVPFWF